MCRYASTFNTVDVQAATVRLNKTNATLVKGQTLQLKLQGTSKKAKWYSSRKRVATITQNGKIIARNKGVTTITAQIGNKKYVSRITIETPKISKTSINLNEGDTYNDPIFNQIKIISKNFNNNILNINIKSKSGLYVLKFKKA